MSENAFAISKINDFVFCPVSIYYHDLDNETDKLTYQDSYQLNGTAAHTKIDSGQYSDRIDVLQNVSVYSSKYNLYGKIDLFDNRLGLLTERKKHINKIYDGYVFQVYAQYFCLVENGYSVNSIRLYSYDNNIVYSIPLPEEDTCMLQKFEDTIHSINEFSFNSFIQTNIAKCKKCIYEPLCSYSLLG